MRGSVRQRALNFVVGNHMKPETFVDAGEDETTYYGRCENPYNHGVYLLRVYSKREHPEMEQEIRRAMAELDWIAAGNEFPTPTPTPTLSK